MRTVTCHEIGGIDWASVKTISRTKLENVCPTCSRVLSSGRFVVEVFLRNDMTRYWVGGEYYSACCDKDVPVITTFGTTGEAISYLDGLCAILKNDRTASLYVQKADICY